MSPTWRPLVTDLRFREPSWYEHRFLVDAPSVQIHVFSAGSYEVDRMLLFRDRLRSCAVGTASFTSAPNVSWPPLAGPTSRITRRRRRLWLRTSSPERSRISGEVWLRRGQLVPEPVRSTLRAPSVARARPYSKATWVDSSRVPSGSSVRSADSSRITLACSCGSTCRRPTPRASRCARSSTLSRDQE
jgi:hypothetical protein